MKKDQIYRWLSEIPDPEIPVISIVELGMVRDVKLKDDQVEVDLSPTYTACPAMKMIEDDIYTLLGAKGCKDVVVRRVIDPPWTTADIKSDALKKLEAYGIAPPSGNKNRDKPVHCPHCSAEDVAVVSAFGSTPCKALYCCKACGEPFDYFKCHL